VRPHPDHLHGLDVFEDLIDKAVLQGDSSGKGPGMISDELLIRRGGSVKIFFQ